MGLAEDGRKDKLLLYLCGFITAFIDDASLPCALLFWLLEFLFRLEFLVFGVSGVQVRASLHVHAPKRRHFG